jgi:NAD(P)-dependent dehydrogenase (short-subunit alcohol dehydrogenase family)
MMGKQDDAKRPKAYVVTGPTSGIGRATALELAKHGTVVLVARNHGKLHELHRIIARRGQQAVPVVCDLSDPSSVRQAAAQIVRLQLRIDGLINNAGIREPRATLNALGWDNSFATNHLGPFLLTETLAPHLPDGANVVFVVSAVEDPERKPAVAAGFRGGRYISVEASARGKWEAGGSKKPGFDAYATSKQTNLASALAFARETPRLRINAVEPGLNLSTGLGRDERAFVRMLASAVLSLLVPLLRPFIKVLSTPTQSARVIAKLVRDASGQTGGYYDERGQPMLGSVLVRDTGFQDRVVAETRAFLSAARSPYSTSE